MSAIAAPAVMWGADFGHGVTMERREHPEAAAGIDWYAPYTVTCEMHGWLFSRRNPRAAERAAREHIASKHGDPEPITLRPCITGPDGALCILNREHIPAGTVALLDYESWVICADCARHCDTCRDPDCGHPPYRLP